MAGRRSLTGKWADRLSDWSSKTGAAASTLAITGLVAAPTGLGLIGFEGGAAILATASTLMGAASAGFYARDGDLQSGGRIAIATAAGIAGGRVVGSLAGKSLATKRVFGDLSASEVRTAKMTNYVTSSLIDKGLSCE